MTRSSAQEPWKIGHLLCGPLDTSIPKLWRVVYIEPQPSVTPEDAHEYLPFIYLLPVAVDVTPHSTVLPIGCRIDIARAALKPVAECIRLPEMGTRDSEVDAMLQAGRDAKFSLIEPLVAVSALPGLMSRQERARLIEGRATATKCGSSHLRKLLTRYWWYGCDKNALIDLKSLQGGPGKRRLNPGEAKRGTPNALARENPNSPYAGVNVSARHEQIFLKALHIYWVGKGFTLADSYEHMRTQLYRTLVKRKDGTMFYRMTPGQKIPTLGQFGNHAKKLIAEHGLKQRNLSRLDYDTKEASRGGTSQDIVFGPGDIFDMDATEFNFEIVASFNPQRKLGKPTVYLVVDRGSTAIVGAYLECRPERWEGYRRALFCAFTPKDAMLDELGVTVEFGKIWQIHALPNGIFSDRGAARHNDALKILSGELNLEKSLPPPKTPYLNAVVESLNKKLQNRLSNLQGGYRRDNTGRAKQQHKDARSSSLLNERQFMKVLIAAIHDHNTSDDKTKLLTPEMNGVKGVPEGIFNWGLKHSPVEHLRHVNYAALYARLLPSKAISVSNKGVRYENCYYDSPALQNWRSRQEDKRPRLDFHIDADPLYLYWRPTPTTWERIVMRAADQKKYRGMTWDDIELYAQEPLKQRIRIRADAATRKVFPKVAEAVLREAAGSLESGERYRPNQQSIDANREFAAAQQEAAHLKRGTQIMDTLAKPDEVGTSQESITQASAPTPAKSKSTDGPSLRELRKRAFVRPE
jgi:hypothetical protein